MFKPKYRAKSCFFRKNAASGLQKGDQSDLEIGRPLIENFPALIWTDGPLYSYNNQNRYNLFLCGQNIQ